MAACGSDEPSVIGVWSANDGTGVKTVNEDGTCSGLYYHRGEPLDIGGVATCTLGAKQPDGTYKLVVRQPPNERTYAAEFSDSDTMVLSDSSGEIVTLRRQ